MSLTMRGGNLVIRGTGSPIECSTCGCGVYCECNECLDAKAAFEYDVVISGTTGLCGTVDGTYRVRCDLGAFCELEHVISPPSSCGAEGVTLTLGTPQTDVRISTSTGGVLQWVVSYSSTNTCLFSSQAFTTGSDTFSGVSNSGSSCVVTYIPVG
jgi:hypothetical protein